MNKFRVVIYGIVVVGLMTVASGCYEWNRRGDYSGYDRVGRSYERNDRRWDGDPFHDREYARDETGRVGSGKEISGRNIGKTKISN